MLFRVSTDRDEINFSVKVDTYQESHQSQVVLRTRMVFRRVRYRYDNPPGVDVGLPTGDFIILEKILLSP